MNWRALACVSLRVPRVNDYAREKKRKKRDGKRENCAICRFRKNRSGKAHDLIKQSFSSAVKRHRASGRRSRCFRRLKSSPLCVQACNKSVLSDNNVPARAHLAPIDYPRSVPFDSVDARRLRTSANRDNYSNFVTKSPVAIRAILDGKVSRCVSIITRRVARSSSSFQCSLMETDDFYRYLLDTKE